jgi:hypothetical protein
MPRIDAHGAHFVRESNGRWLVRIIEAGTSKNGNHYSPELLKESAEHFEGRPLQMFDFGDKYNHLPVKIQSALQGGLLRAAVGVLRNVEFKDNALIAEAVITSDWLTDFLSRVGEGAKGPITTFGLSISAAVDRVKEAGKQIVKRFHWVDSVDVVTSPAAGGAFIQALESWVEGQEMADEKKKTPEKVVEEAKPEPKPEPKPEKISEAVELRGEIAKLREEMAQRDLDAKIFRVVESVDAIPESGVDLVVTGLRSAMTQESSEDDIRKAAKELAKAFDAPKPKAVGRLAVTMESGDKVQSALHKLFDVANESESKDGVAPLRGIQEAWRVFTGDSDLSGQVQEASTLSTTFTVALGNTLHRRAAKAYNQMDFGEGRLISTEGKVTDFKAHSIVRIGGFADLDDVAEAGAYTEQAARNEEAPTVTVTKKGNLIPITWEAIRNDDMVNACRVTDGLGRAARRTLAKAVFTVLSGNGAIWDTKALFHADHGNLGSLALSYTTLLAAETAIVGQAELDSDEPLGIMPHLGGVIVIPQALKATAFELLGPSGLKPGTANNDGSALQWTREQVVVDPFTTDANNWQMLANPKMYEWLVVNYLDGKKEPEVITASNATDYDMFNNDLISYKVRHVWGLGVTDYRPVYGAVVA